jgi:hypothetical protein
MKTRARGVSQRALPRRKGSHSARLSHAQKLMRSEAGGTYGSRRQLVEDSCRVNSSASTRKVSNPEAIWSPPGWTAFRRATWGVCASVRYSDCSIRYTRSVMITSTAHRQSGLSCCMRSRQGSSCKPRSDWRRLAYGAARYELVGRRELNSLVQGAVERAVHGIHAMNALDFIL